MAWNVKGSYAETCSCELMCPCNLSFDHGATYDFCRATLAFHVHEGEIDGTDVAGLNAVVIIDTPKVMTDGNWRLGMFIDERASDDQADELAMGVQLVDAGGERLAAAGACWLSTRNRLVWVVADPAGRTSASEPTATEARPRRGAELEAMIETRGA
jgi:Protein of unknown function (DUF1326)